MFRKLLSVILLVCLSVPAVAADLSITAGNVEILASTTTVQVVRLGATVTAGQPVYRKSSDGKYYKCDCDDADDALADAAGIIVTGGAADAYGVIVTAGPMDLGASLSVGANYLVSDTAGGIKPAADIASGDNIVSLGVAVATDKFYVDIKNTEYAAP